jgi:hypothetical protein
MKKLFLIIPFLMLCFSVCAQVPIEFTWVRLKASYPPISPLPIEKTFDVKTPERMKYLESRKEINAYWSPYGLILPNKWKTNEDGYTFKLESPGINIVSTNVLQRPSSNTVSGMEFIRIFTFTCPATLVVIDNTTKQTIKTVVLIDESEQFSRDFHRNFFITDKMNPNYGKVVGFDSLIHITRLLEKDNAVYKHLEGQFASEKVFEDMKSTLVHLYGKAVLWIEWPIYNPRVKDRKGDYSDFDAAHESMKKVMETLKKAPGDTSYISLLNQADKFYTDVTNRDAAAFVDYIPYLTYWNLMQVKLLKGEPEQAKIYHEKLNQVAAPRNVPSVLLKEPYEDAYKFFTMRKKVK